MAQVWLARSGSPHLQRPLERPGSLSPQAPVLALALRALQRLAAFRLLLQKLLLERTLPQVH